MGAAHTLVPIPGGPGRSGRQAPGSLGRPTGASGRVRPALASGPTRHSAWPHRLLSRRRDRDLLPRKETAAAGLRRQAIDKGPDVAAGIKRGGDGPQGIAGPDHPYPGVAGTSPAAAPVVVRRPPGAGQRRVNGDQDLLQQRGRLPRSPAPPVYGGGLPACPGRRGLKTTGPGPVGRLRVEGEDAGRSPSCTSRNFGPGGAPAPAADGPGRRGGRSASRATIGLPFPTGRAKLARASKELRRQPGSRTHPILLCPALRTSVPYP